MKNEKSQRLKDLFHEFMIFVIFGLGIALPVIIYKFSDILSQLNISYLMSAISFTGS